MRDLIIVRDMKDALMSARAREIVFLLLKIIFTLLLIVAFFNSSAKAQKVNWDAQGKPQIEKSDKPIKGCYQGGIGSLGEEDNNSTKKSCN